MVNVLVPKTEFDAFSDGDKNAILNCSTSYDHGLYPLRLVDEVEHYQIEVNEVLAIQTPLKNYKFLTFNQLKTILKDNPQE